MKTAQRTCESYFGTWVLTGFRKTLRLGFSPAPRLVPPTCYLDTNSRVRVPLLSIGFVEDGLDALLLLDAAHKGDIKRIRQRPTREQKAAIRPGSTFIYCEQEAKISRWFVDVQFLCCLFLQPSSSHSYWYRTDGLLWTPSHVSDCMHRSSTAEPMRANILSPNVHYYRFANRFSSTTRFSQNSARRPVINIGSKGSRTWILMVEPRQLTAR